MASPSFWATFRTGRKGPSFRRPGETDTGIRRQTGRTPALALGGGEGRARIADAQSVQNMKGKARTLV